MEAELTMKRAYLVVVPFGTLQLSDTFLRLNTLQNPGGPYLMQKVPPIMLGKSGFNCQSVQPATQGANSVEHYVATVPDDELVLYVRS